MQRCLLDVARDARHERAAVLKVCVAVDLVAGFANYWHLKMTTPAEYDDTEKKLFIRRDNMPKTHLMFYYQAGYAVKCFNTLIS